MLEEGFGGDWGIVLEPTNLKVMTAEKGLAWYHFTVKGKPTHASRPERGVNAINKATKLMLSLLDYNREIREKSHPLCGRSLCSITMINAGTKENVIPESCWLAIDRRIVPGETIQQVDEEIDSIIRRLRDEDSEFECEWNRVMLYESAEIPVDHEIAKTIRIKTKEITGSFPEIGGTIGSTDQRNFINDAGIPAVSWGPGYGKSHEQDEYVEIKQVVDCAKILVATIFELLK
jgi:succinyl-diaminopimelate desuccinylase